MLLLATVLLRISDCPASVREPPLPPEFRFASDSLFPVMKDSSRASWVLEKLQPILAKYPRHAPLRQVKFWALAVSGAPVATLWALTDSLVDGVYPVGSLEPPGRLQQAQHCLEFAQVLLDRGEGLQVAESYARRAMQFADPTQPLRRAEGAELLARVRLAQEREAVRNRDSLLVVARTERNALRDAIVGIDKRRTAWDYVRDSVEMLGALATAFAVIWAIIRYIHGRDDRTVSRYEANYRSASSLLDAHMASFQGLASDMVGRLFLGETPVAARIVDIIYSTSSLREAPNRRESIKREEPNILQWVRFGIGSTAWRARDMWGQTFDRRVSRVRLDSALAEQLLLLGGALVATAYRRQFKDKHLATWMVEIAQGLVDSQASGQRLAADEIKAQWSLLLFRRMITHDETTTYADVFNPFHQISRAVEEAFGSLSQREKVACLDVERRMAWPKAGLTIQWLEGIVRERITQGPQLDRCLERVRKLADMRVVESLSPDDPTGPTGPSAPMR